MERQQPLLIVDGSDHMRTMLQHFFNQHQLQTQVAETTAQAQRLMQQPSFHFILTDLFWPQKEGLRLVRHVRELALATPVVVMAPFPSPGLQARAQTDGAYACLAKPFSLQQRWALVQPLHAL